MLLLRCCMLVLAAATLAASAPADGVDTRGNAQGTPKYGGPAAASPASTPTDATSAVVTTADALSALTQQAWQLAPTPVASVAPTSVTKTHWLTHTLTRLEGDGVIGTPTSVQFVPGRGDGAAYALHRGVGRCCNRWCEDSGFINATASVNCVTPIPEATLLLLTAPSSEGELRSVDASFLADKLHFPHSLTVAPDGGTLYVVSFGARWLFLSLSCVVTCHSHLTH